MTELFPRSNGRRKGRRWEKVPQIVWIWFGFEHVLCYVHTIVVVADAVTFTYGVVRVLLFVPGAAQQRHPNSFRDGVGMEP